MHFQFNMRVETRWSEVPTFSNDQLCAKCCAQDRIRFDLLILCVKTTGRKRRENCMNMKIYIQTLKIVVSDENFSSLFLSLFCYLQIYIFFYFTDITYKINLEKKSLCIKSTDLNVSHNLQSYNYLLRIIARWRFGVVVSFIFCYANRGSEMNYAMNSKKKDERRRRRSRKEDEENC